MRTLRLTFLTLALTLGLVGSAAQAATTTERVVDLQKSTAVREYDGWLLFSRWDGSAYHLSTWHAGHVSDLAVPAQEGVFDADVGPDSDGRPSAVYSQCGDSCDLFVIGLDPGDQPRPVDNANTTGEDEIAPSVWHGRLVFGRKYSKDKTVAYTKRLIAPRRHPSDRLAGLPSKRCGAVDKPACRPIEDVALAGMDLAGRWVAQSWTYQPDNFPGFRQNEIRLTNVARTDTRQIAAMVSGEGGQTYLGPAIVDGRVAFFKACHGDPGGCSPSTSGAFRYRISKDTYDHVADRTAWTGWTLPADQTTDLHVPSDFDCSGGDPGFPPTEQCGVIRRTGLQWAPIAASHVR